MANEMVPANPEVDPMAETTVMAPPMRVKLMVSHPGSNRPKIKMVKVNGCTFYRKGDTWKHADNACRKAAHFDWKIRLTIDGCSLNRVGGEWKHDAMCDAAKKYLELGRLASEAAKSIDAKEEMPADQKVNRAKALQNFATATKPRCLATDAENKDNSPLVIAGWPFTMNGDLLRLRDTVSIPKGMKTLYEKVEHVEIHLTRQIGGSVKEFTEAALAAIARVQIPATPLHQHLTVEV